MFSPKKYGLSLNLSSKIISSKKPQEPEKISEEKLWKAFFKGQAEAVNAIYQENVDLMYNYGCQFTDDHEMVKDCIQDVFFQLIKYQPKIGKVFYGKAYLLRSLQREIVRKKKKQAIFSYSPDCEEKVFRVFLSKEIKMMGNQLGEKKRYLLKAALQKLTKKQREAILLYYYEGFSYEEIALIMDIKLVKSARKLIYKAISSLKSSIRDEHTDFVIPLLLVMEILWRFIGH